MDVVSCNVTFTEIKDFCNNRYIYCMITGLDLVLSGCQPSGTLDMITNVHIPVHRSAQVANAISKLDQGHTPRHWLAVYFEFWISWMIMFTHHIYYRNGQQTSEMFYVAWVLEQYVSRERSVGRVLTSSISNQCSTR